MEIFLSREISGQRIFPAIDITQSGTRKEALLLEPEEYDQVSRLRRALAELGKVEAAKVLVQQLQRYSTNRELLAALMKI